MRILFVAFPFSIHTARWLQQLGDRGWDIHLFSSMDGKNLHTDIKGITFHENFFEINESQVPGNTYRSLQLRGLQFFKSAFFKKIIYSALRVTGLKKTKAVTLQELIRKIKPDIIHSLETQHAGYLVAAAKRNYGSGFPVWIHSNWGIDLHFFGKIQKHLAQIQETLMGINILLVEGKRDEELAREYGFKNSIKTFPSVGGGFHIPDIQQQVPSARKTILVKGMHDMVRRGLVALRALERCVDLLSDYDILLYSADENTIAAAELFYANTGKKITIVGKVSQTEMLKLNASARLNICINMSDGLPNAMLEAMMMGSFPIQSGTSLASEWLIDGVTGLIVPPEDPEIIEQAIRRALADDAMVDYAAGINSKKIATELNYEKIKTAVIELYTSAAETSR